MALRMATVASVSGSARRIGPLSDRTRVYVNELTFRIVTHAAGAE